ncbi:MAG: hypothetical protein KF870_02405 [Leadbetterella sp.]|nr:hypothetical protein [Leadbetterella sp.]
MKKVFGFLLILLVSACDNFEHKSEYEKSFQKWQSFKAATHNSYRYILTGSTWTGVSWETELVVQKGEVTERKFRYTHFESVKRPVTGWDAASAEEALKVLGMTSGQFTERSGTAFLEYCEWEEKGVEVGTHTGTSASSPITLDSIYQQARNEWLRERENVTTYFEARNEGLISSAGYVEDNCADDCFRGVNIRLIEKL